MTRMSFSGLRRCVLLLVCLFGQAPAVGAVSLPPGSLLFSGRQNDIWDLYLWTTDSTGYGRITAITATPEPEGNPVYWAAKKLILCSKPGSHGLFEICALDLFGREVRRIGLAEYSLGWPQPSPDDRRIAAVREDPRTGRSDPGVIDWETGVFQPLDELAAPGGQPAWLDADRLLISRVTSAGFDLCLHRLSTGEESTLVSGGKNWQPATLGSPSQPMLFTRRVGQISSIFRLRPVGDSFEYDDFSFSRTYDWMPSLTPDGRTAVFLSLRDGRFAVVVRSLIDSSEFVLPIDGFQSIYHPTWIPIVPGDSSSNSSSTGEASR